jgi:hypothetical protein
MKDPIDPSRSGYILDVARLKLILSTMPDDAEIIIRRGEDDTNVPMDELEIYMSTSDNPANVGDGLVIAYDEPSLIIDLTKLGDQFNEMFLGSGVDDLMDDLDLFGESSDDADDFYDEDIGC